MLTLHTHKRTTLIKIFTIATILPIATFAFSKILTINSVSAVTYEIPEGYTTIVDPIFYDCVVKEFISEFPNESIAATGLTDQQLAQINHLVYNGQNQTEKITDSTGLEKMTSLTYLYLGANNLSEVDVTKNTSLTVLNLSDNNLSEIDVTKNTNLTYLILDDNNLSEIDVTKNTSLTVLSLRYNNLSEIDVTKNTNLTELLLSVNYLSEIDVTKNTNLTGLRLAENSIFDFSSAENLTLDQYSSFHRQSQTIETESTTYVLPPLFTQVKTEGWGAGFANPMYTGQPFILTNATLSADGKSITITNPDEPATIKIDGGMADGSILTINYTGPEEHTYTLSFNANGGTNAPAALTYGPTTASSHTFTIPTTAPTYSGHTFLGWADTANATTANQDYASGHTITINANKTLYAVWQVEEPEPGPDPEEHTYTLSFNANGGTNAPAALTYGPTTASSHTFTIPTDEPTYSGHTFLGWADTANATTANQDYASGRTITINANKTLYAVWQVEEPEPGPESGSEPEPEPEPGSEPESEPESTAQVPDTGLITGDGQNGVNDHNTATFIPLLVITLTSIHIILKIRAKILSKTH